MSLSAAVVSILTSAVITLGLRAFPFLVFGKQRRMPDKLVRLGDMLPSAIMAVLVIYCMNQKGNGGAQRFVQHGRKSCIECKRINEPNCETDGSSSNESWS